jgi:HEAT repeat protein
MALLQLRTPEAEPLLAAVADDPAFPVREALCRGRQLDPGTVREDALLPPPAKTPGPQMVPTLIGLLQDPKPSVRQAAALKLSQMGDPAAAQAMLDASRSHADIDVRRLGVQSLYHRAPTPELIPLVAEALRHTDTEMRETAIGVLARLPGPEGIAHIAPLIGDPAASVRMAAAHALCHHASPAAEDAAVALLTNADWRIRQLAVQRFTRAPSPKALGGLREAAVAPEREIRMEALRAINTIQAPEVVAVLARGLDDPEDSVRGVAAEMLRSRPEPASFDVMLQALASSPRIDVRNQAAAKFEAQPFPAAAGTLAAAAKHEDDTLRATALRALGRIDGPAGTAPLVEALADPTPEVYLTAARMLAARRDDPSEQAMVTAVAGHPDVEVRRIAVTRFHGAPTPKAIPALTAAIKQDDDQLRLLATQALHAAQVPEAIDPLIGALDDPSEAVRQTAFGALSPRPDPRAQAAVAAYKAKMQGVQ